MATTILIEMPVMNLKKIIFNEGGKFINTKTSNENINTLNGSITKASNGCVQAINGSIHREEKVA